MQTSDEKSKRIQELDAANAHLYMENRKLQEKNDYLRTFCDDLEQIVVKLDSVKRTYDSKNAGPGGESSNKKNFNGDQTVRVLYV